MPETSDNEEPLDPYGETVGGQDPLGPFDAFRARRAEEQAANEPFPAEYGPVAASGGRRRLRSVAVLAGAAVLVAGVVGGVYAATRPSGTPVAAPATAASASASASPGLAGAKGSKGAKSGKAVTAKLTVTSVSGDSFTATAANGRTVTVRITDTTKFGTAARPFTRSQLATGAVVYARLRREADGTVVAAVIASPGTGT